MHSLACRKPASHVSAVISATNLHPDMETTFFG
jgi:hypothetical protein